MISAPINSRPITILYDLVEIHTLHGKVFIRADMIKSIGPSYDLAIGKTMIVATPQYYWTDEPAESIAEKVKNARIAYIDGKEQTVDPVEHSA